MLKRVQIENFRCLRDVELELEPLTVLVGPNASGKSAVLDALRPCRYSKQKDHWRYDTGNKIHRRFVDSNENCFSWRGKKWTKTKGSDFRYTTIKYQKLQLDLDALRSKNLAEEAPKLDATGCNLTNVFSTLTRDQQVAVCDELCKLVPVYGDIDVRPVSSGKLQLEFQDRWNEEVTYSPQQVSDGTMLMLAYLVLQYQETSPDVVAVEEPERALHPYLLERLVKFFRQLATGQRGPKEFNIVLATHSAELLDFVRPEEVRFLDRKTDTGETVIEQLSVDEQNWEQTMDAYLNSLGNAWLSGGLGGVPGR